MGKDKEEVFKEIQKYVIDIRYANQINRQICQGVVAEIKYMLSCADISNRNDNEAKSSLDTVFSSIDYEELKRRKSRKFQMALEHRDYREIITLFNEKGIAKSIGHYFGVDNTAYCTTIINLLNSRKHDDIINVLLPYFPEEIPR